jgi:hypothetical protein
MRLPRVIVSTFACAAVLSATSPARADTLLLVCGLDSLKVDLSANTVAFTDGRLGGAHPAVITPETIKWHPAEGDEWVEGIIDRVSGRVTYITHYPNGNQTFLGPLPCTKADAKF